MFTIASIERRIRHALKPCRYSLPPEAELYARRHKSAKGQQEFRWITIGAEDREGGGTHVQIKSSTGEIVAGPESLTGKKVGELGKSKTNTVDGHKKVEAGVTATSPDGSHPRDGKVQSRLDKMEERTGKPVPEVTVTGISQDEMKAKSGHAAILDHLKTGKHTSLTELRDAIGDSPKLMEHLQNLADNDRISMHKPRSGEPGLWMTPEQIKRHEDSQPEPDAKGEQKEDEKPTAKVLDESKPSLLDSRDGDPIPAATEEPRKEAAKLFEKEYDSEYAFARKSTVPNFGEDVLGSARHKRNAWRGLADAEANGTAEGQVTRDNLFKNEPHGLMALAEKNPLTSLAMYHALKLFPPKPPQQSAEDRKQYVEEYQRLKSVVEEQAKNEIDPNKATAAVLKHVRESILRMRADSGRYNPLSNAMCGMQNPLWKSNGKSVKGKLNEFAAAVQSKYGSLPQSSSQEARELMQQLTMHVQDIIEGRSLPASFDSSKTRDAKWSPADRYVGTPKRVGGKDVGDIASSGVKASKHLVDAFKMKAVQWGNSVTDKEREHHGRHAVESFTDLADVLGLKPEDVSLNGKIALAIGSRGRGGSSATYHPGYQVINLNRSGGVGALAHEWGHAFDHSLEEYGLSTDDAHYASERLPRRHAIRESAIVKDRAAFDRLHPPLSEAKQEYAKAFSAIEDAIS